MATASIKPHIKLPFFSSSIKMYTNMEAGKRTKKAAYVSFYTCPVQRITTTSSTTLWPVDHHHSALKHINYSQDFRRLLVAALLTYVYIQIIDLATTQDNNNNSSRCYNTRNINNPIIIKNKIAILQVDLNEACKLILETVQVMTSIYTSPLKTLMMVANQQHPVRETNGTILVIGESCGRKWLMETVHDFFFPLDYV
jgi:hypothetical protein